MNSKLRQLGLVVATAVASVTIAGSGVASAFNVPINSVNSSKIVNNTVRSIDIKDGTITGNDVGDGSLTGGDISDNTINGNDVQNGSIGPSELSLLATTRWAKVDAGLTTTLLNHRGATSASRLQQGQYVVTFAQPITGCGWSATVNDNDAGSAGPLMLSVERNFDNDANSLRVRTFDHAGAPVDTSEGDGFTLTVVC
jgi:hypothetical protein